MSAIDPSRHQLSQSAEAEAPLAFERSTMRDRLAPARGLVIGILLSIVAWIVLGCLALLIWRL